MASSISTSTLLCPLTCSSSKLVISAVSSSTISHPKSIHFHLSPSFSPLNRGPFLPWNGLKRLGISKRPNSLHIGRKNTCKGMMVYASLFGVGAPEALVIGVVALLVFGPKGLAEVARNLGKTLRAFQPTIRELQEVSREFKSSLEREIGLDDISSPTQNTNNSNPPNIHSTPTSTASTDNSNTVVGLSELSDGAAGPNRSYSSEEYLKITEEQLKASAAVAQQERQTAPPGEDQIEPQTQPPATGTTSTVSPLQKPGTET